MTLIPSYFINGNFYYIEQAIIGAAMYLRGVCLSPEMKQIAPNAFNSVQIALAKDEALRSGHILIQATLPYDSGKYLLSGNLIGSLLSLAGYAPQTPLPSCDFPQINPPDSNPFLIPNIPEIIDTCEKYLVWLFSICNKSLIEGARNDEFATPPEFADFSREIEVNLSEPESIVLLQATLPIDWEKWLRSYFLPECVYQVAIYPV